MVYMYMVITSSAGSILRRKCSIISVMAASEKSAKNGTCLLMKERRGNVGCRERDQKEKERGRQRGMGVGCKVSTSIASKSLHHSTFQSPRKQTPTFNNTNQGTTYNNNPGTTYNTNQGTTYKISTQPSTIIPLSSLLWLCESYTKPACHQWLSPTFRIMSWNSVRYISRFNDPDRADM